MQQQQEQQEEAADIAARMAPIKHKILVLSGKGGVGKSTVAVNLAHALHQTGHTVGLMDADIHGPSIPTMLGLTRKQAMPTETGIIPVETVPGFKVMSIGLLLPNADDAIIWRGPLKYHTIRQFIKDVEWGTLDYLIVDLPPGTGDEPLTVAQSIPAPDGAVVVTTPQQVAITDVRKCISFCRKLQLPVLGVVENMSAFACPHCGGKVDLFAPGGGARMAKDMNVAFLGSVPIDPTIGVCSDAGLPFMDGNAASAAAKAFAEIVATLRQDCEADASGLPGATD